uniref:Uncharacterized protein n=1 Tax=viral metagenome TaxID=1070528 RepID=A0A6C0AMZ1_9ZZZZ
MKKTRKNFNAKKFKAQKKIEDRLFIAFDTCRTRKCSKYFKEQKVESQRFTKEQDIQCPQKNNMAFFDCIVGFYDGPEGSKLRKLSKKIEKCANKKCRSHLNKVKKQSNVIIDHFMEYKM